MDYRTRLYGFKEVYNHEDADGLFINAVKGNVDFHRSHCKAYDEILKQQGFDTQQLKTKAGLQKLPCLPTLYFKRHALYSMAERSMVIKATSSGTGGKKSSLGFDLKGLMYAGEMTLRMARFHGLLSLKPANYLILGYEPHRSNHTVINKTQRASMLFAPPLNCEYALLYRNGGYRLNLSGLKQSLKRYASRPYPVRIVGFPSYLYFLLKELQSDGISLTLPPGSMIMLGGGWKQHYKEKVEKTVLYEMVRQILGIREENCREFFGAAEHPALYCDCKNHHFHVPTYSRVIIRDVDTLRPLDYGQAGLLNLISPMMESVPLVSVITDDLAVLHKSNECGCGIRTPYFEIIGRSGIADIKTCAAGAGQLIRERRGDIPALVNQLQSRYVLEGRQI
ncbi:MAG: acyl-protein synthetase [Clostridiaceae bacterium]|nr:acyl-protein synthetase [Clostridiaceae bacterium]